MPKNIFIYGVIGDPYDNLTAKDIIADILDKDSIPEDGILNLRINSPGGDLFEAIAVYNFISEHLSKSKDYTKINSYVDGWSLSAATVITLAATHEIIMGTGTQFMVHAPSTIVWGNALAMRKEADRLDGAVDSLVAIYNKRYKGSIDIKDIINKETWFSDEETVLAGFATSRSKEPSIVKPVKSLKETTTTSNYRVLALDKAKTLSPQKPTTNLNNRIQLDLVEWMEPQ